MAGRLPKVTEYIKNIGKSVGYASIDIIKEPSENLADFIDTNEDLFKVIYSATRNYKETIKQVDRSIKNSKLYEAADAGFKALKEDLRTGQFYNKKREDQFGMSAFGDDFADFSEFETDEVNFNWNDDDFADEPASGPSDEVKMMAQTSAGLGNVIASSSRMQSNIIVSAAEGITKTNKASTRLLSAQNEKINASIVAGFSGVNAGMNMIASVLSGPVTQYMNESTKFYGDVSTKLNEISAYLKESTEMQRNLYKVQQQEWKNSKYDDIVSANGMPDIKEYAKNIYKNIMNLDPTGGMLTSSADDENLFKAFVGSPLKAIPMMIAKLIIPNVVSKSLKAFNDNIGGLFPSLIARFNSWAEDEGSGEGLLNIKGILGSILGIKIDKKTGIDTSKYNRGPMPFDGETKKAIVDVIPAYLARIESAISGMPERVYDGKSGKFKTVRQVQKEYRDIQKRAEWESVSSLSEDFDIWARKEVNSRRDMTNEQKNAYYDQLKGYFRQLGKDVYADGGDFRPYEGYGPKGDRKDQMKKYAGGPNQFDEELWTSFMRFLSDPKNPRGRKAIYEVAGNTFSARQRHTRELNGYEGGFANAYTALFDDRINILDKDGKLVGLNGERHKEDYIKNNRFKSATDYLKDILAEVRYIRMNGIKGRGSSGPDKTKRLILPGNISAYKNDDFDSFYNENFGPETYEDEIIRQSHYSWEDKPEKVLTDAERYGLTKENALKNEKISSAVSKWDKAKQFVDKLVKKPADLVASIIQKADQRIFQMMFGDESGETFRDKAGLEYRGFLDYLITKTENLFDDLKDKLKSGWKKFYDWFKSTKVGGWIAEKGEDFLRSTGAALKDKFNIAKNRVGSALDNTYGALYRKAKGQIIDAQEVRKIRQQEEARKNSDMDAIRNRDGYSMEYLGDDAFNVFGQESEEKDIFDQFRNNAYGGVVTKYGLTMLSPGEIVIPNPLAKTRKKNLIEENKEKARIIKALKGGNISNHAQGTVNTNTNKKSGEENKLWSAVKKVMGEVDGRGGEIAADAIIGSGVSLITGMVGGPLLGAAAGAGFGFIKNSKTIQTYLFGEETADGGYKEGVIPKDIVDKTKSFFDKNGKSMLDFGIAGGIAGLFTPLGLVGGALVGASAGFVKNTDWFQTLMFGNEEQGKEGLMSPDTKRKLEKALPAMGIGAGVGALLGPFGLVGNVILGSAAGYVVTSDKFKEMILGKEDEDGKRKGGVAGAIKAGLIEPLKKVGTDILTGMKDYVKNAIIKPTTNIIEGIGLMVKNSFVGFGDRVADMLSGVFKKHVGMPIEEFLREKIFKPFSKIAGGFIKGIFGGAKAVFKAPFTLLGGIGNSIRAKQIARGTQTLMNAQERLDFRNQHKIRFGRMGLMGTDKTRKLDATLAGMNATDLEAFQNNINQFISNRGQHNKAYVDLLTNTGNDISAYFDANNIWNDNKGYKIKKVILNALQDGDYNQIQNIASKYGLSDQQIQDIMSMIDTDKLDTARKNMETESGLTADALKQIRKVSGYDKITGKGGNRWLKQLSRLTGVELKARKAADAAKTPEEKAAESQAETADTSKRILDVLISINNNLANKTGDVIDPKTGKHIPKATKKNKKSNNENATSEATDNEIVEPTGDNIEDVQARRNIRKRGQLQEMIAGGINSISNKLGSIFGKKPEKENTNIISRLLSSVGVKSAKFLAAIGGLSGVGKAVGAVAATIGATSLIGYGSEFVKKDLIPALEKSELLQTLKNYVVAFGNSIKDGSFFVGMAGKLAQGINFAMKNVMGPMTEAIISCFPSIVKSLAVGVAKGVLGLFKPKKENIERNYDQYLKSVTNKMISGKDEKMISSEFSGTAWSASNANIKADDFISNPAGGTFYSEASFDSPGTYENGNGSTSVVDEYGNVSMYDKNGTLIGTYNQNTGAIIDTNSVKSRTPYMANVAGNALKVGLAGQGGIGKGINAIGRKLFSKNSIMKSVAKMGTVSPIGMAIHGSAAIGKSVGRVATEITSAGTSAGSLMNKVIKTAGTMKSPMTLAEYYENAAKNGVNILTQSAKDISEVVTTNNATLSLSEKIAKFGIKLANSTFLETVFKFLAKGTTSLKDSKALKDLFEKLFKKLGETAGKNALQKGASKAASVGLKAIAGVTPLTVGFWVTSFLNGAYLKTETILGISKDLGFELGIGARCIVGLVNAIDENLLLGLIPTEILMDAVISICGKSFGIDAEEYEEAKKATKNIVTAAGLESGETKTLAELNNQQGLLKKLTNAFGNTLKSTKITADNSTMPRTVGPTTKGGVMKAKGRGRGGQQGGIYANMPYGNSTIGQAGCAPVAAASMLGTNIPEAARFAQSTGHVSSDGSTDIGFFNDYFSAKGISNRTTTSRSDVSKALKNGQSAVMLGRDPGGGNESAYSNSSHFITARGTSDGKVLVNDPALGLRKMSKNKVLKNMKASVLTGRARDDGTASTNAQKVINVAKSQVGYVEGANNDTIYGKEYGMNNQPWCVMFVWWVFKHAGASKLFYGGYKCASCNALLTYYRDHRQTVKYVQPGDLVFFNFNGRTNTEHVAIATSTAGVSGSFSTVEGNTSSGDKGSQSNGGGVYQRTRYMKNVVGIARPAYEGAVFDDVTTDYMTYNGNYNYSDSSYEENSNPTLFDLIGDLGKNVMRSVYGDNLFNAIYGDSSNSSTNSGYSNSDPTVPSNLTPSGDLAGSSNDEKIWRYLRSLGYSKAGTAGIMGNLYKESGLIPSNLQNTSNKRLGMSDDEYTNAVNNGTYSYSKFINDNGGYGLAQWTPRDMKKSLYEATISKGRPINSLKDQLDLIHQRNDSLGIIDTLQTTNDYKSASDLFLERFERPKYKNYNERRTAAKNFYDKYQGTGRGYANRVNTKYLNDYSGKVRSDSVASTAGTVSQVQFLQTIIEVLLSIADNTDALNKILEILSNNFNINVDSNEVQTASKSNRARETLRSIMSDKSNAEELSNILQSNDTSYLVDIMTSIARE